MFIELCKQLSFKDCLLPEEESQLVDAGVFKHIQIDIFDFFLIQIVLNDI